MGCSRFQIDVFVRHQPDLGSTIRYESFNRPPGLSVGQCLRNKFDTGNWWFQAQCAIVKAAGFAVVVNFAAWYLNGAPTTNGHRGGERGNGRVSCPAKLSSARFLTTAAKRYEAPFKT